MVLNGHAGWTDDHGYPLRCPYGEPGDRLWVKEAFYAAVAPPRMGGAPQLRRGPNIDDTESPWFGYPRVAWSVGEDDPGGWVSNRKKVSPLFMPRWASRMSLEVTDVRLERLQAITEEDARAEGCSAGGGVSSGPMEPFETDGYTAVEEYAALWDELNGKKPGCAWKDAPWVWVISFERVTA